MAGVEEKAELNWGRIRAVSLLSGLFVVVAFNVSYWGVSESWAWLKDFSSSPFFTAIVGAFFASWAGAAGAQRIAERSKLRDQLLKELRDTNAATSVAFHICNSFISLKRQHVLRLKNDFDSAKAAFLEHVAKVKSGQISREVEFHLLADLQSLTIPPVAIGLLQTQIFERITIVGRALSLTTTLGGIAHELGVQMVGRNELIEKFKQKNPELTPQNYFGLQSQGVIHAEYSSLVEAISRGVDDIIYFSRMLGDDLAKHGNATADRYQKEFPKEPRPSVSEPKFERPEILKLFPDAKPYEDWETSFQKKAKDRNAVEPSLAKRVGDWFRK